MDHTENEDVKGKISDLPGLLYRCMHYASAVVLVMNHT